MTTEIATEWIWVFVRAIVLIGGALSLIKRCLK